jgi:histidine triad (HIT) family protein
MANEVNDCIFCKIIKGEIPAEKTYEDDNFMAFLDIKPKAEGHTIIIPKNHFRNLLDMPTTLGNEMLEAIKKVSLDLIKQKKATGFNLIVNNEPSAGQIVFHAHLHIIPRDNNDRLKMLV